MSNEPSSALGMALPKTYNPKEVESKIYKLWEESGFFNPDNLPGERKEKFVAAIAPPNITGELHMGHALEHALQDIVIRMKRMQGYKTLWIPGIDHASIAVHVLIEKELAKEGLTRHKIGREEFLKKAWAWKEKYGDTILNQFKKLGLSVDWSRTRFTMDPGYQKAVGAAFHHYYKKGWVYQGERVINWCVKDATSISDLEVNHISEKGRLYYIKYGPFTLATARPETKLGDTALAVHPNDQKYKKYVGSDLEIESVDNSIPLDQPPRVKKIKIKVVADEAVDIKFGTGVIKVTPAHDITDSEIGQRHGLSSIKIINEKGRMNENAGKRYEWLRVGEAREQIVKDLQALGLIEKVEDYIHNIARCDRCNSIIEPLPSRQWFLKMSELAKLALLAHDENKIQFYPGHWAISYENWLKNLRDWNISRQLWWGHKIPIEGEDDILDTWFSAALWPFAILGWPEKTKDLQEYYPTQFITCAREIIFLWVIRMIFSGMEFTGQTPFKDIYVHPVVQTKDGKRMSKSLGTGISPLGLIEKYGTDALRFGLTYQTTGIQDMRFNENVVFMGKKFANKFWNITRYVLLNVSAISNFQFPVSKPKPKAEFNKLILEKIDSVVGLVTKNIGEYKFGEAAHVLYDFIWHDVADKYIEETKNRDDRETKDVLAYLLLNCLKLLHPFMPFITEKIYSMLPLKNKTLLLIEKWPV